MGPTAYSKNNITTKQLLNASVTKKKLISINPSRSISNNKKHELFPKNDAQNDIN